MGPPDKMVARCGTVRHLERGNSMSDRLLKEPYENERLLTSEEIKEKVGNHPVHWWDVKIMLRAQDTKSFKDGYDKGNADGIAKGRAEVVEWVRANNMCTRDEFETQCKAWGLGDKAG